MTKIAFLGLGVMGYPMAGHLYNSSYEMAVYNRTSSKGERWLSEFGGKLEQSPRECVKNADLILSCVGNDDDLRSIVYGENGILSGMKTGAIFLDHTTASANVAREIFKEVQKVGGEFLDGPVSGGQAGAENGTLTVMVGGNEDAFNKIKSIVGSYAQAVTLLGDVGCGQLCKMVNQICIAGLLQSLSEGIAFGQKAGLDVEKVINVISKGAAQSWQMENRGKTMIDDEFNFGFAVDWMRKDLAICLEEADRNGALLPITAIIDQFYKEIQNGEGSRWDTSSLIKLLNR